MPQLAELLRDNSCENTRAFLPALGADSELVVFVFEQDVERGKRSVTARDILSQRRTCPLRSACLARRSLDEGGSLAFTFSSTQGGSSGKPGRCFASVAAPMVMT